MQVQLYRDIEQIKKDNKELGLEHNTNKESVAEFRYKKKFCGSNESLKFKEAKNYTNYTETLEFLRVKANNILNKGILNKTEKMVLLNVSGIAKGYKESYPELAKALHISEKSIRNIWSLHGKDFLQTLKLEYKKVEQKC